MKIYLTPFGKGEICFNIKGDVTVKELIDYVKDKLKDIMEYKEASYLDEEDGEQIYEFESSVKDVIYNVTITGRRVKIIAENIKGEDDPEIIRKAQEILNAFKDINSYFYGRKLSISKIRFHTDKFNRFAKKEKIPFEI